MKKSSGFFGVIAKRQTYLNMLYLLLSFILGIFYFVFLVTGISIGLGMVLALVGVPILVGMIFLWREFAKFEKYQTEKILGVKLSWKKSKKVKGFWNKLWSRICEPFTWKSLGYLFVKFPLGIFSFVILITFLSIALSFIAVPFVYYLTNLGSFFMGSCVNGFCFVQNGFCSILWGLFGILFLFVSLHLFNWIAKFSGLLAKGLLGRK